MQTTYETIKQKQYELEALLSSKANNTEVAGVKVALSYALDYLRHQVAEYIRTAEKAELI